MSVLNEPLLEEPKNKYVMFPLQYPELYDHWKLQEDVFWVARKVDISKDYADFMKLDSNEQHFIKNVLAFFAASDGIVMENLTERFQQDIKHPEVKGAYAYQTNIEAVHSEMYSLLIDAYIKDEKEKEKLFDAMHTVPCIKEKAEWALRWISADRPFAERLVAFAMVEGIFFSGSFCAIYWLKDRGLMKGLCESNEYISRDEGLHTDFACLLYSKLNNKLSEERLFEIVKDAVKIETGFIIDSLKCRLIGMNSDSMTRYIKYVANRLCLQLGYNKVFPEIRECPFDFMKKLGMYTHTNFFEKQVTSYEKSASKAGNDTFELDANF